MPSFMQRGSRSKDAERFVTDSARKLFADSYNSFLGSSLNCPAAQGIEGTVNPIYRFLKENVGAANRITRKFAQVVMKKMFSCHQQVDEDGNVVKAPNYTVEEMVAVFGPSWPEFARALEFMEEFGLGIVVAFKNGETWDSVKNPLRGNADFFVAVDPMYTYPSIVKIPYVTIRDQGGWTFYGKAIDLTRMCFLQVNRDESNIWGHGVIQPLLNTLVAFWRVDVGLGVRIDTWSLNTYIQKKGPGAMPVSSASMTHLQNATHNDRIVPVDSKDDIVQIGEKGGMPGDYDILLTQLSLGSEIPKMMLQGNSLGSTTGAEKDLQQWGNLVTKTQSQVTPFVKDVAWRFFGMDLGDIDWNVDFYTTEDQRLDIERKKVELKRLRNGEMSSENKKPEKETLNEEMME
jgi:hypothetical protein